MKMEHKNKRPVTILVTNKEVMIRPYRHLLSSHNATTYEHGLHLGRLRDVLIVEDIRLNEGNLRSLDLVDRLDEEAETKMRYSLTPKEWIAHPAEFNQNPVLTLREVSGRIDQWYIQGGYDFSKEKERVKGLLTLVGGREVSLFEGNTLESERWKDFAGSYGLRYAPELFPAFEDVGHLLGELVRSLLGNGEGTRYFSKPDKIIRSITNYEI